MVVKKVDNKIFEYNEDKYEIDYSKNQGIIILRKRCSNEILKVFDNNTTFILEYDNNSITNFLVGEKLNKFNNEGKLYHYIEENNKLFTFLISKLDTTILDKCRITDNTFITKEGHCENKYALYNIEKGILRTFNSFIKNDEINELVRNNKLFIKEVRNPDKKNNTGYSDTLTYLIDTDNFEVCSKIWSNLEQRFIRIYTKEEAIEEYSKAGININLNKNLEELTKELEIDNYIKKLNNYLELQDIQKNKNVNKEFILKFINKNN